MSPGGTCSARIQPSKAVLKSAAVRRRDRGYRPDLTIRDPKIEVIKIDDSAERVEIALRRDPKIEVIEVDDSADWEEME
jgi:hypothetical protein